MGKAQFNEEHMRMLETDILGTKFHSGDIVGEDEAEILNTFNWAYHEGEAMICHNHYEDKDNFVAVIRTICEKFNVYYRIFEDEGGIYLELIPE